jgi:hypothetical protein
MGAVEGGRLERQVLIMSLCEVIAVAMVAIAGAKRGTEMLIVLGLVIYIPALTLGLPSVQLGK